MKFQEQETSIASTGSCGRRLGDVLLSVFVVLACFTSGCASNKAVDRPADAVVPSVQSSAEAQAPEASSNGAVRIRDSKDAGESPLQDEKQVVGVTQAQTIKASMDLKPLLAVMPAKSPGKTRPASEPKIHVELAFDNADLYEMLDVTLYEIFKVNYMVDPDIRTKVSFHLSGDYTQSEFINILNNVLQLSGLSVVKGPGDIFKIVRRETSAGFGNEMPFAGGAAAAGDITRMLRLRYIAAANAANNIKPFLSKNAVIVQDPVTNSLTITDTVDNLEKAANILGMMDVEYFEGISWRVFPIKDTDASDMAKDLSQILKTGSMFNRPGIDQGSLEIVPIKTMNALLVVTRWPSMLSLIDDWIRAMDNAGDAGANVFVYFVENGTASDLANILRHLFG